AGAARHRATAYPAALGRRLQPGHDGGAVPPVADRARRGAGDRAGRAGHDLLARHRRGDLRRRRREHPMTSITTACLDMAGTTVSDDGSVMAAFTAAVGEFGLEPGEPGYDEAIEVVHATMGQSKIEVFRRILGDDERAQQANRVFEASYAD